MSALTGVALTKRYNQRDVVSSLDLEVGPAEVVGLLGPRGIGKRAPVLEDRIGRLLKEKRRLALIGAGGLSDVVQIVASNAIDSAHRKPLLVANDRQ